MSRTLWDEEFKELNSIELSGTQKAKLWRNITAKKRKRSEFFKLGLIYSAAAALFLVLTASFISGKLHHTKDHSAAAPPVQQVKTKPAQVPVQQLAGSDSKGWEPIARERIDLAAINKVDTSENKISITVTRIKTFGYDTDPLNLVMNPDTDTQTYILRTTEQKKTLNLQENQKVLLKFNQYQKTGEADTFWGAEVVGVQQKDGKYFNADGDLLTLLISSQVSVTDGKLEVKQ